MRVASAAALRRSERGEDRKDINSSYMVGCGCELLLSSSVVVMVVVVVDDDDTIEILQYGSDHGCNCSL